MPAKDETKAVEPRVPKLQTRFELIMKRGKALAQAKKFDEASGVLGRLLEMCTKAADDQLSIDLGPIYFEYGNTLLEQVLEATTGAETTEMDDIKASGSAASAPAEASGVDIEQTDIEELLEIAWECLESARLAYEKHSKGGSDAAVANRERMAAIMCRLGQVQELSGRSEDGARDMLESLRLYQALPDPSQRDLADVNLLLSNVWLALANSSDDDTAAPKLAVAIKHHVAAFEALYKRCMASFVAMGAGAAPLVAAVEAWWASIPASRGHAVAVAPAPAGETEAGAAASSSSSSSSESPAAALAASTDALATAEALGSKEASAEANRLLVTLRQMQERLDEVVDGNEEVAAQLAKKQEAAPKRQRDGEAEGDETKRTKQTE